MRIEELYKRNKIAPLDWLLARTLLRLGRCDDPWVGLAAALVSRSAGQGNVCLDLSLVHERGAGEIDPASDRPWPIPLDDWLHRLARCTVVGGPGSFRPLILEGKRLYLHRYWRYEQELARLLLERAGRRAESDRPDGLEQQLDKLFPDRDEDQKAVAGKAATQHFTVISGGPGTGKTYTVAKIILLLGACHEASPLKIHLAAPTGKAAARLQESIEAALKDDGASVADEKGPIPTAQTLHRLLGYMPSRSRFRYDAKRPLPTDAVIVDEASMIDLALMHQLVQAVPDNAKLILVGDKDQLASVEAGAVLGDICYGVGDGNGPRHTVRQKAEDGHDGTSTRLAGSTLRDHIQVLDRSYRFDSDSGLGALSRAVNAGDAQRVISLLSADAEEGLSLVPHGPPHTLDTLVDEVIDRYLRDYFLCREPQQAFVLLHRFRFLCALRRGPYGAETLNRKIERALRRRGLIPAGTPADAVWYRGRPLMVVRNDYHHNLFNGDTGIVIGPDNGPRDVMQVAFPTHDGGFRKLAPHQLPDLQTVYAMSVHKSQGSEFDHVTVVLPDRDTALLTRELIYTAITRARKTVTLFADPELLTMAVRRRIRRSSGLRYKLWPDPFQIPAPRT